MSPLNLLNLLNRYLETDAERLRSRLGKAGFAEFQRELRKATVCAVNATCAGWAVGLAWSCFDRIAEGELDALALLVLVKAAARGENVEDLESLATDLGLRGLPRQVLQGKA